jgi:hypothetical protein
MCSKMMLALAAVAGAAVAQEQLCSSNVIPGYSKTLCDARVRPNTRVVVNGNLFYLKNLRPSIPDLQMNKETYGTSSQDLIDLYGPFVMPQTDVSYGTVNFEDWHPVSATHCALICDQSDDCHGFSFKTGQCWLIGANAEIQGAKNFVTYMKSTSSIRDSVLITASSFFPDKGSATLDPLIGSTKCDAYAGLGEPCTFDQVAGTTAARDSATVGLSTFTPYLMLKDGATKWVGSAPSVFVESLADTAGTGVTLNTEYDDGTTFTFPSPDADCGCEYENFKTSIVSGAMAGYGFYEAAFSTTATEFLSGFWFQGPEAEINVLQVENGVASVSWHCFGTEDLTSAKYVVDGVDASDMVTATLHYTDTQITWLVNGKIAHQISTPECLKGVQMRPILSVEVGDVLPSTASLSSGDSMGAMTVAYYREWDTTFIVEDPSLYPAYGVADASASICAINTTIFGEAGSYDSSNAWIPPDSFTSSIPDDAGGGNWGGLYKGPVPYAPQGYAWKAECGTRLLSERRIGAVEYWQDDAQTVPQSISSCGQRCLDTDGCSNFWYEQRNHRCRVFYDHAAHVKNDVFLPANLRGNVVMTLVPTTQTYKFNSYGVALKPLLCVSPAGNAGDGFSRECYSAPNAFGARATMDIDDDGIVDFGCPYDRSEFVNPAGKRVAKACTDLDRDCTVEDTAGTTVNEVCAKDSGGNFEKLHSAITPSKWVKFGWSNYTSGDAFSLEKCLDLCRTECSCKVASWREDRSQCWLLAKGKILKYRVTPATGATKLPLKVPTYTTFVKTDAAGLTSGEFQTTFTAADSCDRADLISKQLLTPVDGLDYNN